MMSARIEDLEPVTRGLCEAFMADTADAGIALRVTHTLRTLDEQARLYAQGRTLPGPIVTKAKPGASPHNFGMAFDICFSGKTPYPKETDPRWSVIGKIGEAIGLSWGGPNGKGDRFTFDRPHFERRDWKAVRGAV
jgi:peptidoglycan L-alanyl-D-glutamate endopeptidase CwlK